jgi:hypothetical protein
MHLDEQELLLLARFFAKRFPDPAERAPILARAGLPDEGLDTPAAAWEQVLRAAQDTNTLPNLGRAVQVDDPDDENLREMRRILIGEPTRTWRPSAVLAAVGAAALLLTAGAAWGLATTLGGDDQAADAAPVPVARTASIAPDLVPTQAVAPTLEPAAAEPEAVAAVDEDRVEVPVDSTSSGLVDEPVETAPEHCGKLETEVRGYWYAGSEDPGKTGDTIIVPRDVNVRSAYPRFSNGYDTEAPIRCVLYGGDLVRLSRAPIHVPFNRYWVATAAADLTGPWGSLDARTRTRDEAAPYTGDRIAEHASASRRSDREASTLQEQHTAPPPTESAPPKERRRRRNK